MKKRLTVLFACLVVMIGLVACSSNNKSEEPQYVDDTAMETIAKGYEARQDVISEMEQNGENTETSKAYKKFINTELDIDKELKDAKFKDSQMQEDVLSYINSLQGQLDVVENNSPSSDSFYTEWSDAYDKRCSALKVLVEKYDLTVSDKYKDDFDDLVANGTAATKKNEQADGLANNFNNVAWDCTDDGYGSYTYSAVVENTTQYTYSNVTITLGLYDADGVRQDEAYADVNSWAPGEKVRFEAYGTVGAQTVKVEPTYYEAE